MRRVTKPEVFACSTKSRDALASVLGDAHQKRPFVTMCFADPAYKSDEAHRAPFESSYIYIPVGQHADKQMNGFMQCRTRM
jgi:hypothetical protein